MLKLNDVKLPLTENEKRAGRVPIYKETVKTASLSTKSSSVNNGFFSRLALVNRDVGKEKKKKSETSDDD